MENQKEKLSLRKKRGRYMLRVDGSGDIPVFVLWARPLSGKGKEVSFLDEKKKEVAMIGGLHCLDPDSRTLAEEALNMRYLIAKIVRIHNAKTHFGTRYIDVETNIGPRKFAMQNPSLNISWDSDDKAVIRDVHGNMFAIESVSQLDKHSQHEFEKVT